MTRFTYREIEGRWYTWDELEDRPVSAGKKLEISAKDRASLLNSGLNPQPGQSSLNPSKALAEFDAWAEEYGHTDPVIAALMATADA